MNSPLFLIPRTALEVSPRLSITSIYFRITHQGEVAQRKTRYGDEQEARMNSKPKKDVRMTSTFEPAAMPDSKSWLQEVQNFAQEFRREIVPPAPKASLGVGPVKYHIKFPLDEGVNEKRAKLLDEIIHLEQSLGDYWIKIEANLIASMYGREDPIKWLPAAQRYAIRCELFEITTKFTSSNGLAQGSPLETSALLDIIRMCSLSGKRANLAELSLVAKFVPKTTPLMAPNGTMLVNSMSGVASMEELAKLVDMFCKQQSRIHALHRFMFKLLHAPDGDEHLMSRRKYLTNHQPQTEGESKEATRFSDAETDSK
ncbi:hypothetical protein VTL71DRAFT_3117 [Oculimacula yallundae]|uniref:Uncharacterized protein n=1 Tax=Oculimacula yallundae TaxID=86028 RepID=A0ABR4C7G5_9HELO